MDIRKFESNKWIFKVTLWSVLKIIIFVFELMTLKLKEFIGFKFTFRLSVHMNLIKINLN